MVQIRIEGKWVIPLAAGHLYLVFVDDDGHEYVIRGGPTPGWNYPVFGSIVLEPGTLLSAGEDSRLPEQRHLFGSTVIDLEGRDAHKVWAQMIQHAHGIASANLPYDIVGQMQNSNSVVASVLHSAGIEAAPYVSAVAAVAQYS
jgi:hypothetical protein